MMRQLFDSLARRSRPEDVADLVLELLGGDLDPRETAVLQRAARSALRHRVSADSSMLQDFASPVGLHVQVERARVLFGSAYELTREACSNPVLVERFLRHVGEEIKKDFGRSSFLSDRLNREARSAAGLALSRRNYNRKFRLLARMEVQLNRLAREWRTYRFRRIGKSVLATQLTQSDFASHASSAAFIAYYVARSNLRNDFTMAGQARAFDEIAAMLFARCQRDRATNWWAIAHVYPTEEVLEHLTEQQKDQLLFPGLRC